MPDSAVKDAVENRTATGPAAPAETPVRPGKAFNSFQMAQAQFAMWPEVSSQ